MHLQWICCDLKQMYKELFTEKKTPEQKMKNYSETG